jgi:hypothetical protein
MSASDIAAWAGFFGIVAQVGATLAGLIFVGLTISLQHVLASRGYLSRAVAALFQPFGLLVIGVFGRVPNQPASALGGEFIVTGAALLVGISLFSRSFPEDENSAVLGSKGMQRVRAVLTYSGTLFPVASGAALIAGWSGALYLLIPAIVACVYLSIGYAWVFAVEIPRRSSEKR